MAVFQFQSNTIGTSSKKAFHFALNPGDFFSSQIVDDIIGRIINQEEFNDTPGGIRLDLLAIDLVIGFGGNSGSVEQINYTLDDTQLLLVTGIPQWDYAGAEDGSMWQDFLADAHSFHDSNATNQIFGGNLGDSIYLKGGADIVRAGFGDDRFFLDHAVLYGGAAVQDAVKTLIGGGGTDRLVIKSGVAGLGYVDLRGYTLSGIEELSFDSRSYLAVNAAAFGQDKLSLGATVFGAASFINVSKPTAGTLDLSGLRYDRAGQHSININGSAGNDVLTANAASNDTLVGDNGSDRLTGLGGADFLSGGAGNDTMLGGAGDDQLSADAGSDVLTGGSGEDTFSFFASHGKDRITDFDAVGSVHDLINLAGLVAINGFADLRANHLKASGGNVLINTGDGGQITLTGVALSALDAGDFAF